MKKRFALVLALVVAIVALGAFAVMANNNDDAPASVFSFTGTFNVMEDMPGDDGSFSMISADGELIIHIHEDTPVYFEDYLPTSDDDDADLTRDARELLFGRTLAELLEGRNLTVYHSITTMSLPPQTSPQRVVILFETAVHLPLDIDPIDFGTTDLPFEDIADYDWFFNAAVWAFENGIMQGISETEFGPEAGMTRAMLVTILWRYAGEPASPEGAFAFGDVDRGAWYVDAVEWAAANGIVAGVADDTFAPYDAVNREQMYTILYRYMNFAGLTIALEEEMRLQAFDDADLVSDWASDAMHLMFDAGIMFRYHDFDFYARPQQDVQRAEIAGALFFFNMHTTLAE